MRRGLFCLAMAALMSPAARAANIAPGDAAANVGQTTTVCGTVASVVNSARLVGHPTYLNFGGAYPHQQLTVTIWGNEAAELGDLHALAGKRICITGPITTTQGVPQIYLQRSSQLEKNPPEETPAPPVKPPPALPAKPPPAPPGQQTKP